MLLILNECPVYLRNPWRIHTSLHILMKVGLYSTDNIPESFEFAQERAEGAVDDIRYARMAEVESNEPF